MLCFSIYGFGVAAGVGSSLRRLSCGGASEELELPSMSPSAGLVDSGWRRFNVGLPSPPSSMSLVTPALAFVSFNKCDFTL